MIDAPTITPDLIAIPGTPQVDYRPLLDDAIGLASASKVHRKWSGADRLRLFAPPLILGQYMAFHRDGRPVGFFSWANLTEAAERGYLERTRKLQPADWNAGTGDRIWVIDGITPFGGMVHMARSVRDQLRRIVDGHGWPVRHAKWVRSFGSGSTQRIGRVKR